MTKILVTGGSGFIGSNFIHYIMKKGNYSVINLDNLTYAGNEKNNEDFINNPNYSFIRGDITCYETVSRILIKIKYIF